MTELFEKSIHTLELPKVLAQLAAEAVTQEGKERALALRPMIHPSDVARTLEETTHAATMIAQSGSPSFSGVKPVAAALQRAQMGGSLNTRELLDIAAVLRSARGAKAYGDNKTGGKSTLDHLFYGLTPNRTLEDKITGSIVGEDEIADSASGELAAIRRQLRASASKVRDILQKLLSSNQARYLQENLITIRSDRYVVPVKAEHKNEIQGLVHDVSSSGSTFFVEPLAVVKANNEIKELHAREEQEIARILAELSGDCAVVRVEIQENYHLLVMLDSIFARGHLSYRMGGIAPKLSEDKVYLRRARHPLLDAKMAVTNDLMVGENFDTLVVTGPNTGGKTVTIKTLGLLTLMAQCGLHIPVADDSYVRVFHRVLADVGDEQSIAQSLSTFSSHMVNIVGMLEETDSDTLILFDELGAGTDPIEGAALAAAIIESARNLGAYVAATTHYAELKIYAMTTPGVENASCEFDVETLAPTYRLLVGVPGKSNAFAISRRLGLPQYIIDKANQRVDSEHIRFEDVLSQLEAERRAMEENKMEAQRLKREMEETTKELADHKNRLTAQRAIHVKKAEEEARTILEDARDTADKVFKELNQMRRQQKKESDWQSVNDQRAALKGRINQAEGRLGAKDEELVPEATRPAQVGDTVTLVKMGTQATVLAIQKDGSLQLQAGILKITAKQSEVRVAEGESQKSQKQAKQFTQRAEHKLRALGASPEVDLRGMTSQEALGALDIFLDNAVLGKLTQARIIHGKGTGAVRKAVREHVKRSPYVKSSRPGQYGEGEDGVTVVELR